MLRYCLFIPLLVIDLACHRPSETASPVGDTAISAPEQDQKPAAWAEFRDGFLEEYFEHHPAFAAAAGRHEFDGLLPDWSTDGVAQRIRWKRDNLATAKGFDTAALSDMEIRERAIIIARLKRDLFWIAEAKWHTKSPSFYFDWVLDDLDPGIYVIRNYAPLAKRLAAYTKYADSIVVAASQIQANLSGSMPKSYIYYGQAAFAGLADFFERDVPTAFATIEDPAAQKNFRAANQRAIAAMRDLAAFIKAKESTATDNFALGPDLFQRMLQQTIGIELSLEELEEAGRADLLRNQNALKKACDKLAPKKPLARCLEKVTGEKPKPGPVEAARVQVKNLRKTLEKMEVVTIPGEEEAAVEESPPYARQNSAFITIPGPYESNIPSTYYISPPDPNWPAAKQLAYIPGEKDLLFTSVHEIWPGHFLQYLHSNGVSSKIENLFVGYNYAEGWAHYAEELMCEEHLCVIDPAVKVGQLLNALLRNIRYLSAIGLHARGMTMEESEALFTDRGFQDSGTAQQQAARGTYDPAYLNYTLGKLQILKLRQQWTEKNGGRENWKLFHDTLLGLPGPNIQHVRVFMFGDAPARETL